MGTSTSMAATVLQGLKLVHFSAQRKRFLWDRGCIQGVFQEVLEDIRGCSRFNLCQKRLRLSRKVSECKPLPSCRHRSAACRTP